MNAQAPTIHALSEMLIHELARAMARPHSQPLKNILRSVPQTRVLLTIVSGVMPGLPSAPPSPGCERDAPTNSAWPSCTRCRVSFYFP